MVPWLKHTCVVLFFYAVLATIMSLPSTFYLYLIDKGFYFMFVCWTVCSHLLCLFCFNSPFSYGIYEQESPLWTSTP